MNAPFPKLAKHGRIKVKYNPTPTARTEMKRRQIMEHEFTIIAHGLDPDAIDFEARFYDGGCDDALVSYQKGHILIDFAREADTLEEAIASAIENVRNIGAIVDRLAFAYRQDGMEAGKL